MQFVNLNTSITLKTIVELCKIMYPHFHANKEIFSNQFKSFVQCISWIIKKKM